MTSPFTLIGLSGKAGVGKDYIAEHYLRPAGYLPVSLADHFKLTIVGRGLATYEEVFFTKPPHVRKLLQEEGTERGRDTWGVDVWCHTLGATMRRQAERWGLTKFVVADVRFPNEVQWVRSLGGYTMRIRAPQREAQSWLTAEQRAHVSETALDGYGPFDADLDNDRGYEQWVEPQLKAFLHHIATERLQHALST